MIIQSQDPHTCAVTGLGELTAANASQMRDAIRAALPAACTRLDLDMSGVTFVDSSGLGALIALHKTLRSRDGTLRLLQLMPAVRQILEMTRLHRVFEIVP